MNIVKKILCKDLCPIQKITNILSDEWTILIIRDLMQKDMRFTELEKSLTGISTRTLTIKLNNLLEQNIIEKKECIYSMSEKGLKLKCVLDQMTKVGKDF